MTPRTLSAGILGLIAAAIIAAIAIGYAKVGEPVSYCTWYQINDYQWQARDITAQGLSQGYREGQIVDQRDLNPDAFLAFNWDDVPGSRFELPVKQGAEMLVVPLDFTSISQSTRVTFSIDLFLRIAMAAFGIVLIAWGRGLASFAVGGFLVARAASEGYVVSFAGLPASLRLASFEAYWIIDIAAILFLLWFAVLLLPSRLPKGQRTTLLVLAAALATANITATLVLIVFPLTQWFPVAANLSEATWLAQSILVVTMFGISTTHAAPNEKLALQIVFLSALVGFGFGAVNQVWSLSHIHTDEVPVHGALDLGMLFMVAGWGYAVIARRLFPIEFFVSRTVVYGIVGTVIVFTFVAVKILIEELALGRIVSSTLDLLVAFALGISVHWMERRTLSMVDAVFFKSRRDAIKELRKLSDDLHHVQKVKACSTHVAESLQHHLHSPSVVIYGTDGDEYKPIAAAGSPVGDVSLGPDDPGVLRLRGGTKPIDADVYGSAFPPNGAIFPLSVLGSLLGAIYCAYRHSRERYDPEERDAMRDVARELAIVMYAATG